MENDVAMRWRNRSSVAINDTLQLLVIYRYRQDDISRDAQILYNFTLKLFLAILYDLYITLNLVLRILKNKLQLYSISKKGKRKKKP